MLANSDNEVWEEIYQSGKQVNRFPFSHVVQFFRKYTPVAAQGRPVQVLELGCGVGNNLWGLAREGCIVTGIDWSSAALEYAQTRFKTEGLTGQFLQFCLGLKPFPLPDGHFDLVIDRGALCYLNYEETKFTISEVSRVLTDGGRFLFTPFSKECTGFDPGRTDASGLTHDIPGPLGGSTPTSFYDLQQIAEVLPYEGGDGWRLLSLELIRQMDLLTNHQVAEYRVVVEKTPH